MWKEAKEKENKKEPIRHVYHYQFEKKQVEEVRMDRVKDLHPLKTEYIKVGSEYYSTTPCIDFDWDFVPLIGDENRN